MGVRLTSLSTGEEPRMPKGLRERSSDRLAPSATACLACEPIRSKHSYRRTSLIELALDSHPHQPQPQTHPQLSWFARGSQELYVGGELCSKLSRTGEGGERDSSNTCARKEW